MAEQTKTPAATTPLVNNPRSGIAGMASEFIRDKYSIDSAIYPIDLFSNRGEYGDNYVVFYINVPESSKLITEGLVSSVVRDTVEVGSAIKKSSSGAAILTGGAMGAAAGASFGGALGGGRVAAIGTALGAIAGGGAGSIADSKGLVPTRQTKRITDTITLNIPNNLVTRYSVNWDVEDLVLGSAAADVAAALANKNSAQSAGTNSIKDSILGAGANLALTAANKLPLGNAISATTGVAPNPKKEQLFKNVDFRTFNFEYQFAARNKKESESIDKIIKLFKLHMHPEFKDSAGFLFLYPSEFEIVYYQGDSENMNLPRHTSSVLVDMSVNYTPQNMYNTFDDGASTLITLNLTFKELAILTKAEILDGF